MQMRWPCMDFKFGLVAINVIMHVSTGIILLFASFSVRCCLILVFYFAVLDENKNYY